MSSGGVFQIVANEGRTDRMLLATALLNQRISDIQCARRSAGKADCYPTLLDIEKTHVLFTNAHFKPYVAMAYEYRRVRPTGGSPTLGTPVTFSLPQVGEFFSDMAFVATFDSAASVAQLPMVQSTPVGYTSWTLADASAYPTPTTLDTATVFPYAISDATASAEAVYFRLVDYKGSVILTGGNSANAVTSLNGVSTYQNLVHYVEFPANRLFAEVKFDVNDNPLDKYDTTCSMIHEKFFVPVNKRNGYNKLCGQEVPMECWSSSAVSDVVSHDSSGRYVNVAGQDTARFVKTVVNGPQTPKLQQPRLELLHKLRFWFNEDVRLAVPSVCIPYGQRFITTTLANAADLITEEPGLFLERTISSLRLAPGAAATARCGRVKTDYFPIFKPSTVNLTLLNLDLYVNNLYVNPEIHDIYIRRIGFSLIRVHLYASMSTTDAGSGERTLTQLKWPIEYIMLGIRPRWNVSTANRSMWRDWHRFSKVNSGVFVEQGSSVFLVDGSSSTGIPQYVNNAGTATTGDVNRLSRSPIVPDRYVLETPTIDTLKVVAHGIPLYDTFNTSFYNTYLPYTYGGANLNTPKDSGVCMINFCLYPKTYQPSGHFNLSRAREFNVQWTTSYVTADSKTSSDLIVVASAINFLLISDGSAVLRFST